MSDAPLSFVCEYCDWEGTDPVLDAHLSPFCPRCDKPAEFEALARRRKRGR